MRNAWLQIGILLCLVVWPVAPARADFSPRVELHTHFRGLLPAEDLIEIALEDGYVQYPTALLDAHGISYPLNKVFYEDGAAMIPFQRGILSPDALAKLKNYMSLSANQPRSFTELEHAYDLRRPFTYFHPAQISRYEKILRRIAKQYQTQGIKYAEISTAAEILSPEWISLAETLIPKLERETGVKLRFLLGLRRNVPRPKYREILVSLKLAAEKTSYIVGVDFLGEEVNSTENFASSIRELAKIREERPGFQIRVHAGENNRFPNNIKEAIKAGATRIGHGVYGLDDETLRLARENGVIVELNPSSNLALGNVTSVESIPLKRYLDAGVRVTISTDGSGIFQTNPREEARRLRSSGLAEHAKAIQKSDAAYVKMIEEQQFSPLKKIVAFVPGSFDPPTRAHLKIMRLALDQYRVGKLYVVVNSTTGTKDYNTTFQQRKNMLREALARYGKRVEIIPQAPGSPVGIINSVRGDAKRVFVFVGEDAFLLGTEPVPPEVSFKVISRPGYERAINLNSAIEKISLPGADGISASRARELISKGKFQELDEILEPMTVREIRRNRLYHTPQGADLLKLQTLYFQAFAKFYRDHFGQEEAGFSLPPFNPAQSPEEWPTKFARALETYRAANPVNAYSLDCPSGFAKLQRILSLGATRPALAP